VSQKELAQFIHFKMDVWKMYHCFTPVFIIGGWVLPFWTLWLGNWTFLPSTFPQSPAERDEWREAQDLYRYRYAHAAIWDVHWFMSFLQKMNDNWAPYWDELYTKNDHRRENPKQLGIEMRKYENFQPFWNIRRKQARAMCRAMGIPTFPAFGKLNMQARIRDMYELLWNEDYMVITGKLHETMSDEDLQDYAWRRYLAPYDKKLNRTQLLERVTDYHQFLGDKFVAEGDAPNIFMVNVFCMSHYHDPAFLDQDISELDKNDFEHLASWGQDAFLQRLDFENGPLRDQVEAHTQKRLAERAKLLAE